jgi:CDP-glucose 4,6-dehydratase
MEDVLIRGSFGGFYRRKKVLLTGHTGFKGGWMATWLALLGANVTGFSLRPNTEPNLFTTAEVGQKVNSIFGDVRDLPLVSEVFKRSEPEIVIHNAAQAIVRRSYSDPVGTYSTNVMGTVHVLEAARHTASVRCVIVVTSDKCYESEERGEGYREGDAMGGYDPYSSSKGAAELVTAAYRRSFFTHNTGAVLASVRAGNVIGGGDWAEDRLIPDLVRSIWLKQPVTIRHPGAVRPWQHVLDPIRGYLMLAQRLSEDGGRYAEGWNFGPRREDAVAVADLARLVVSAWGKGEVRFQQDSDGPHEAKYLYLNCDKALQCLGWEPKLRLNQAIDWTVKWYRSFYERSQQARAITEDQIREYMKALEA